MVEQGKSTPSISLITPSMNRASMIGTAIRSALEQDVGDVEHLVIDGGSKDGTMAVLDGFPHLRVIVRETGIYEALNLGLEAARGRVIGFLNTDDALAPHALRAVIEALQRAPGCEVASGGAEVVTDLPDGDTVSRYLDAPTLRMDLQTITRGTPIINARFFRREAFDRIGGFDTSFRIAADRDLLLRLWRAGARSTPVRQVVYRYRGHQGSLTFSGSLPDETVHEYLEIVERHLARGTNRGLAAELIRWRAQQLGRVVTHSLRQREGGRALQWARRGFALDPAWPVRFVDQGLRRRLERTFS